jgi:hypothetical protein
VKNILLYQSYSGDQPFVFLRFHRKDRGAACAIINNLIERRFRICYDEIDEKTATDSELLARRILSAALTVFLISADALEVLGLRNSINYALSENREILCIALDDKKPGYGFDMQLANVPGAKLSDFKSTTALCDEIVRGGQFSQEMRGEDAQKPARNNRRKKVLTAVIAAAVAIAIAAGSWTAIDRVNYSNSMAGRIEKMTQADTLDISGQKTLPLDLLKGKTITTLTMRNMGLTDVTALGSVDCEQIDLSGNPGIATLEPLLEIQNLKTVKVTQDMASAIAKLGGRNTFKVVITG